MMEMRATGMSSALPWRQGSPANVNKAFAFRYRALTFVKNLLAYSTQEVIELNGARLDREIEKVCPEEISARAVCPYHMSDSCMDDAGAVVFPHG